MCSDYRNAVAAPTPDEQKWLDTELNQTGDRLVAAANSPIYARSQAASLLDRCVTFAGAIAAEERTDNGPNWAELALAVRSDDVHDMFTRFGETAVGNSDLGIVNILLDRVGTLIVKSVIRPELY